MEQTALVLFGHGARDPEWARPLERVRTAIAREGQRVELAFLEFMAPTLPDCLASLAAAGVRKVVVVPMFIAQGGHLKRDVPQLMQALQERYGDLEIRLTPAVGESDCVIQAMAHYALAQL